jgi:RimK family alpha-L-glutamate ligase
MRFALIARRQTPATHGIAAAVVDGASFEVLTPEEALLVLQPGDVAVGRLDVLPTLDGIDDGLWALGALSARGVIVLNEPAALLAAHDKLLTARLLRRLDIPHPLTWHVRPGRPTPVRRRPVVLKPRFGSWGREVQRCDDPIALESAVEKARGAAWFRRHGALVQELVPPQGYDLRVLVAGGRAVGAAYRVAAPGEWRTNVALGGVRRAVEDIPREAAALSLQAARAIGASLVGVDLLPDGRGCWIVAELNGAVEFTRDYAPWQDVFAETAAALVREARERRGEIAPLAEIA